MGEIKSFSGLLNEVISQTGLGDRINDLRISEIWTEIVGEKIAEVAKIRKIEKGVAYIDTKSSTWSVEFNLRKESLLDQINEKMGFKYLKDLIIK